MYVPDEKLVSALSAALKMEDRAIRALIVAELESMLPEFEEREADAAETLREATVAATPGETELTNLIAEIADAANEFSAWENQQNSGDVGARVAARAWLAEWKSELASLDQKRAQVEADLAPLRVNRDQARAVLNRAAVNREALEANCNPECAYVGYGPSTDAYKTFRWGVAIRWALTDEDNPEHQDAKAHLKQLASLTGREVDWKTAWDEVYAQANKVAERAPSGADEIIMTHLEFEAKASERQTTYIEDMRGVKIPRNIRVPDYKRVPETSAAVRDNMRQGR